MLPIYPNLANKVVVITGGTGVLCGAMARELARQEAKVAVLSIEQGALSAMERELSEQGFAVIAIYCNVLEPDSVREAKEKINAQWGEVDILINGAGGNHPKATTTHDSYNELPQKAGDVDFFDLELEGFRFAFDLNFLGTWIPTQIFAKDLIKQPNRQILNISSMSSFSPLTRIPAYSAAKAAVNNLTQWLAVHFATTGLRVNALAPGFFLTEQNRNLLTKADGTPTPRAQKILAHTPLQRFGTANDLLGTVLWLLDEQSSGFITGQVVPIDGGFMAYAGV